MAAGPSTCGPIFSPPCRLRPVAGEIGRVTAAGIAESTNDASSDSAGGSDMRADRFQNTVIAELAALSHIAEQIGEITSSL